MFGEVCLVGGGGEDGLDGGGLCGEGFGPGLFGDLGLFLGGLGLGFFGVGEHALLGFAVGVLPL